MTEQINKIPARLKNMAKNGHVAGADDIIDDTLNKTQDQVNQELIGADQTEKNRAESAELALRNAIGGLTQSDIVIGALPATGQAGKIYRVPGTNSYSDYSWNGSQFVLMATYNNAIDDVPTANSNNLVKSGGVYSNISPLQQEVGKIASNYTGVVENAGFANTDIIVTMKSTGMTAGGDKFPIFAPKGSTIVLWLPNGAPVTTTSLYTYLNYSDGTRSSQNIIQVDGQKYSIVLEKDLVALSFYVTAAQVASATDFVVRIHAVSALWKGTAKVVGKNDADRTLVGFIDYATGTLTTRDSGFFLKVYSTIGMKSINAYVGSNSFNNAQIAFYSSNEISPTSYLKVDSLPTKTSGGTWYFTANIPSEAVIAVVYDRFANVAESDAVIEVTYDYADYMATKNEAVVDAIKGITLDNLYLVQGGINGGIPGTTSPTRIRTNRMIAKAEAPFNLNVPYADNGRLYIMFRYSTLDDYTSYIDEILYVNTNPQGLTITSDIFGDAAGIAFTFCAKNNLVDNITPADFPNTRFVKTEGIVDDIISINNDLYLSYPATHILGNSEYYGRIQTLKITDEKHKLTSRLVCEHYYDEYPYTRKNQSMAIWDGKAFCFNDTAFADTDGFCVVIDVETGNVITRVTDTPSVVAGDNKSHLNAATFTDQYYQYGDKYPLLLLSRGDYASPYAERLCMYVFRITEPTTNNFVFTRIKTIYTPNNPLAVCNPSWGYDSMRRMIWGHLTAQDWRWANSGYRKFNGGTLYFVPPLGTEYICVSTVGEVAATSATITIVLGGVTTTEQVSANSVFEKVLPYTPFASGCSSISLNQSDEAFTGQYVVFSCDANGNNRKEIQSACAIQGFVAPDLTDTSDYTVPVSDYTVPAYIDICTLQGGSYANGKLFLPVSNYTTINKQPTDFTGHVCLVVDPVSGYIESIIKTDTLENEGCAIWNGKLYVSAHSGGGTGHTITFRLMEYSFD